MDKFAVPKEKQPVTLHFLGGESRNGDIFLDPDPRTLHQKIAAFLEGKDEFFPFSSGQAPQCVRKKSIRMIEVHHPGNGDEFNIMHVEHVTVVFRDSSQVSGDLLADVPEGKRRLSDCLNLPFNFLCTRTHNKVSYINKVAILRVITTTG